MGDRRGDQADSAAPGGDGKLIAVAEHEFGNRSSVSEAKTRLDLAKAKAAALAKGVRPPQLKRGRPELLEENRLAWDVFLAMTTQVRVAGMGGVVGFDWSALPDILQFTETIVEERDRPDLFRKLRALEAFWVQRVNRASEKGKRHGK